MATLKNDQLVSLARSLHGCEPRDARTKEHKAWAEVVIALRKQIRAAEALRRFDTAVGTGWLPHPRNRTQEEHDLARRIRNLRNQMETALPAPKPVRDLQGVARTL